MAGAKDPERKHPGALVLEDNPSVRKMICDALEHHGVTAYQAKDGPEAIGIGREAPNRIQLLIADLGVRGMDAQTTASLLRILQPGAKVLCLSSYGDAPLSHYGINECDTVLKKPFGLTELTEAIRRVLGE